MTTAQVIPRLLRRHTDPARFAAAQQQLFAGMNLRIAGRSRVVHAVARIGWLDGLVLPGPACHQGWSGNGAAGDLLATTWAVTCAKCRRITNQPEIDADDELVLFPLARPPLTSI